MSFVGKSNSFMFQALSQHVIFRHARVHIKQKVTNTICDDQSSYPLIYRRHLPLHIFERVFNIFQMPVWYRDSVCELFRQMGTVGVIAKNIVKKIGKEKPKNGQSSILSSTS